MDKNNSEYSKVHLFKLVILSIAMVGTMTTWFSMTAVLPELVTIWHLNSLQGSFVTIMVQIGFVIGSLISAFINLPDRVQPNILILWSAVLAGVSTILTAILADHLTHALFFRFITGIALSGVYGPSLKLLSTWFRLRRGMALGFLVGALTLGSATPHLFRGVATSSWETVLITTGICSIIGGIIIRFTVQVGPYPLPNGMFDPHAIPRILRHTPIKLANYGYFGHMWELYAMWSWFGLFLTQSLKSSGFQNYSSLSSILTFIVIASGFFGAWFGGVYADKMGREKLTLFSLGVSGTITLCIGYFFGSSLWLIVILGVVWGISIIADSAQFSALITEHAEPQYVGTALTLQLAIGFFLTIIAILSVPLFETLVGWRYAFLILIPGPILGFLSMLRLLKLKQTKIDFGG
ncbi:MFS transporter [Bacillus sp. FJAT-49705]|uniref:MFS transporter n=1 Tax=Cytobacillus citreus TaxID=2833586 RepID=A0ABS5NNV2_9BACI|nr:MFS transporter [Cytobacillus citreus]MBS4189485.1 MFS transporter [Cytobacillus citreus]